MGTEEQFVHIGEELAQARERQNLSLAELSRRTKINTVSLRAIERGEIGDLPGGIFTRGFLRAYAREVGCDPEEIVRRFRAELDRAEPKADAGTDQAEAGVRRACEAGQVHAADIDAMERKGARLAWISCAIVLLAAAGFMFARRTYPSVSVRPLAAKVAPQLSEAAESAMARLEVGTAGLPPQVEKSTDKGPTDKASAENPGELRLEVQPSGPCWIDATADGQRVVYRLADTGEHIQIGAHDDLVLKAGDAAALGFTLNGAPGRKLGPAGKPVTLHITRQNYQEFLDR